MGSGRQSDETQSHEIPNGLTRGASGVVKQVLAFAWYRSRATFRHRRSGYLATGVRWDGRHSVRRRRHDLALLKTLGFTNRQLASTIAWQASVAVGAGTVVGVPLGIALGRSLWELFAQEIDAVPDPSVPLLPVAAIALRAE